MLLNFAFLICIENVTVHFLLDLSLALERVLTGGDGSGVLSLFELRLRVEGVLWFSLFSSTWPLRSWDPFVEPFCWRALPLVKPFDIAADNRLAIGDVSTAPRVFLEAGSGERRGGEWLCFRFLWYLLKVLAKYILRPKNLVFFAYTKVPTPFHDFSMFRIWYSKFVHYILPIRVIWK